MRRSENKGTNENETEVRGAARASSSLNLPVVEEADATGKVAELYERYREHFGRPTVPGILKCFATHPVLLQHMLGLAEGLLFVDGFLTRRHKEMIASLVSHENACPYCADSHGHSLRTLGGSAEQLAAIAACDLTSTVFTSQEQALLAFVDKVTRASHTVGRGDIVRLIEAGWGEAQIAEAVHIAALFATFNRIVNTFGLPSQRLLDLYQPQLGKGGVELSKEPSGGEKAEQADALSAETHLPKNVN